MLVAGPAPAPLGLPVLRPISSSRHADVTTPVGPSGAVAHLPGQQRPSPLHRRVGSHITRFEACATFTGVSACLFAELPKAALCTGGFDDFVTSLVTPIATG